MASLLKLDGAGDEVTRNTFLQRHSASSSHSDDSLLYMTRQKKKQKLKAISVVVGSTSTVICVAYHI